MGTEGQLPWYTDASCAYWSGLANQGESAHPQAYAAEPQPACVLAETNVLRYCVQEVRKRHQEELDCHPWGRPNPLLLFVADSTHDIAAEGRDFGYHIRDFWVPAHLKTLRN